MKLFISLLLESYWYLKINILLQLIGTVASYLFFIYLYFCTYTVGEKQFVANLKEIISQQS